MMQDMFWFSKSKPATSRLYLDYAAATPLLPQVLAEMERVNRSVFGNASAIHSEGVAARQIVERARTSIARTLKVRPEEVFFTASGTEANNTALYGVVEQAVRNGQSYQDIEVISTEIEHPSIAEVLKQMSERGVVVRYAPVDGEGKIILSEFLALLSPRTRLVTFTYANSEIGTVQDVGRLTRAIRAYERENNYHIVVHIDAAQAPLWLPCQLHQLGVDMMSLDVGKCNGPKGIGLLVKKSAVKLESLIRGGGQEGGLRAGTENTAAIAGAALALDLAQKEREERVVKVRQLSEALFNALKQKLPDLILNGPSINSDWRLPHNVHISISPYDTEFAVVVLDSKGIAASTKSACSGAGSGVSRVVEVISGDLARASSTIRFTIDPSLTVADMERVASILFEHVTQMKEFDSIAY